MGSPVAPSAHPSSISLPDGRVLDLRRSRWDGVLDPDELAACRAAGIPLGYDCAQIGWVPLQCTDEDARDASEATLVGTSVPRHASDAIERARSGFARSLEAILRDLRDGVIGSAVIDERVHDAATEQISRVRGEAGLREADRCHWLLRAETVRRVPGSRQATAEVPNEPGLGFRPWSLQDLDAFIELLGNPKVWEYLPEPYPEPFDEETARTLIELGSLAFHQEASAVELDGVPIGQCLIRFDGEGRGLRTAEVAYWLGEDYWGKGLMSRLLPVYTARCFREHDLDVVYAWIRQDHAASAKVAVRSGYQRDTFAFERELAEAMQRADFVRYAVFRSEWVEDAVPSA